MKNHLIWQPAVISLIWNLSSLWFGNISLSLFLSLLVSSPTQSRDLSKISQILSHLREKKSNNPKLQLACFFLVHIKLQQNEAFHTKNVQLKDGFKRHSCDCEFTIAARTRTESWNPKYWLRQQDISYYHWNWKVNNFYLLFFSFFVWNGAHQQFWSRWGTWTFVLCCGNHIIPKITIWPTSCIESRWNSQHIRLQIALLF